MFEPNHRINWPIVDLVRELRRRSELAAPGMVAVTQDQLAGVFDLVDQVAGLCCPEADGFEGPETFSDCGECVVCQCRRAKNG